MFPGSMCPGGTAFGPEHRIRKHNTFSLTERNLGPTCPTCHSPQLGQFVPKTSCPRCPGAHTRHAARPEAAVRSQWQCRRRRFGFDFNQRGHWKAHLQIGADMSACRAMWLGLFMCASKFRRSGTVHLIYMRGLKPYQTVPCIGTIRPGRCSHRKSVSAPDPELVRRNTGTRGP